MKAVHKALAAALLSSTIGLMLPAHAATTTPGDSAQTTAETKSSAPAAGESSAQKPESTTEAKHAVRHRTAANMRRPKGGSERAEEAITNDLNRQSLQSAESGTEFKPTASDTENAAAATHVASAAHKVNAKKHASSKSTKKTSL